MSYHPKAGSSRASMAPAPEPSRVSPTPPPGAPTVWPAADPQKALGAVVPVCFLSKYSACSLSSEYETLPESPALAEIL